MVETQGISERRACQVPKLNRNVVWHGIVRSHCAPVANQGPIRGAGLGVSALWYMAI